MNYENYMKMTCIWQKNSEIDEDTQMLNYGTETEIKCVKYGKNIFIRESDSATVVSAMAYIVTDEVAVGDKIDGQVVKSVNNIPEFDGTMCLYECLTWND